MLTIVEGDPSLTRAQTLLLGLNLRGETEVNPLETALRDGYPVFFSDYRRRASQFDLGKLWLFQDSKPWLLGAFIRESASSVTRLRHVEQVLLQLRQEWAQLGIRSLAIAPLSPAAEWTAIQTVLQDHLPHVPLPIVLYATYLPGQAASEAGLNDPG